MQKITIRINREAGATARSGSGDSTMGILFREIKEINVKLCCFVRILSDTTKYQRCKQELEIKMGLVVPSSAQHRE